MKKNWKKILIALAFVLCIAVPSAMYVNAEDTTSEETTSPADGDIDKTSVSGAVFVYYSNVQNERTSKNAVKTNRDGTQTDYYEAPTTPDGYADYIFAGWYTDESGMVDTENPLTETELSNTEVKVAWAKFVPKNILSVKSQVLGGTNYTKESTSIRFVTSVDTLNYRKVGFDFVIFDESNPKFGRETNTVYERLYGIGSKNVVLNYTPNYVFNSISEYFMAFTFSGVTNKNFGHGISANPYWITLDGTLVYGVKDTKTVNEAYMKRVTDATADQMSVMELPSFATIDDVLKYEGAQGGCFDGDYYYQAIVSQEYISNDYADDETIIQKYQLSADGNSWSTVDTSDVEKLCHANDLTYNENLSYTNADGEQVEGLLIVCHNLGGRKKLSFIDPVSLDVVDPAAIGFETIENVLTVDSTNKCIEIAYEIWSIDYNNFSDRYVVGISGGQTFRVLDANFNDVGGKVYPATSQTTNWTTQGVTSDDSYIYFVLYRYPADKDEENFAPAFAGHVITVYDWDGNFVTLAEINTGNIGTEIEPENISVYNNTMYIVGKATDNKTNIYKVSGLTLSQELVAYIDENEYYFTLEDAVMNATEGDTITLVKDVTVNSPMPIYTKNVTITNKADMDITITRGSKLTGAMFDNHAIGFTIKENTSGAFAIDGASVSGSSLIINQEAASMRMENLSVSNAKGNASGGVIYNCGSLEVTDSVFKSNAATTGGAMYLASGDVAIENTVFEENSSTSSAGAIRTASNADVTLSMTGNTFTQNTAAGNGGAVNFCGGTLTVTDCTFTGNSTTGGTGGGAITVNDGSEATITWTKSDSEEIGFSGNSAPNGGAMYCNNATVTIDGYYMDQNSATTDGGALYFNSTAKMNVQNVKLSNNTAGGKGGAIRTVAPELVLNKVEFNGNTATSNGGAIQAESAAVITGTDCVFVENTSNTRGGAIYITGDSQVEFDVTETSTMHHFNKNVAKEPVSEGGGAIDLNNGSLIVNGYIFEQNLVNKDIDGEKYSSIVAVKDQTAKISDCEFIDDEITLLETGKVEVVGTITGANIVYLSKNARVLVGEGEIDEESTIIITPIADLYAEGSEVLVAVSGLTQGKLANAADIIKVTQEEEDVIFNNYWHIDADGTMMQGVGDNGATVGEGCTYASLNDAINGDNKVSAGATLFIMNDLSESNSLTIDRNIAIKSNPMNEAGVTITRGSAGAMFSVAAGSSLDVRGTVILDGNNVDGTASLIVNTGTFTMGTKVAIMNAKNTSGNGGALANSSATSYLYGGFENNRVGKENTGVSGGAVRNDNGTIYIEGSIFNSNKVTAGTGNGGALAGSGTFTIKKSTFINNTSVNHGGAIHNNSSGTTTIEGCTFQGNIASSGNSNSKGGGAIFTEGTLTIGDYQTETTIVTSKFVSNQGDHQGGAIRFTSSKKTLTITGSTEFAGNKVVNTSTAHGGAIYVTNASTINMSGAMFTQNTATSNGGAIQVEGAVIINGTDCVFEGNISNARGGALYITGDSQVEFDVTETSTMHHFNKNVAKEPVSEGGGAIDLNNGSLIVNGYIFEQNLVNKDIDGEKYSSIVAVKDQTAKISDCEFIDDEITLLETGKVEVVGTITGANIVYLSKNGCIVIGDEGISEDSSIIITPIYTMGLQVVEGEESRVADAAQKIMVTQPEDSVGEWRVGTDGKLMYVVSANDLAASISSVASGSTIYVCEDATITETITIDKNITLKTVDKDVVTLTRGTTNAMFSVADGVEFIVDGAFTLEGNKANYTGTKSLIVNAGTTTLGADVTIQNAKATVMGAAFLNSTASSVANLYCDFIDNVSSTSGGAIRNEQGTINVEGSLFDGNKSLNDAQTGGGNGGAISGYGTLVVKKSTFKNNVSYQNGGAIHSGYSASGSTSIYGCKFESNEASYGHTGNGAGAIMAECTTTIGDYVVDGAVVTTTTFYNNKAAKYGGAIRVNSGSNKAITCTISGSTLFDTNTITGGDALGGAICNTGSYPATIDITGATFTGNTGKNGGALYVDVAGTTVTATDCVFGYIDTKDTETTDDDVNHGNTATTHGGAIYMANGTLKLNSTTEDYADSKFEGNKSGTATGATDGKGGAVYVNKGTLYVGYDGDDTTTEYGYAFNDNTSNFHGGAMNLDASAVVVINDADFTGNKSGNSKNGGAINSYSNDLTVMNTSFTTNTGAAAGGAIMANGSANTGISNCEFRQNKALATGQAGGAVTVENSTVTITACKFDENEAVNSTYGGGAVWLRYGTLTVTDSAFTGNKIKSGANGGGAIYMYDLEDKTSEVYVKGNTTFTGNDQEDIYKTTTGSTLKVDTGITYTIYEPTE